MLKKLSKKIMSLMLPLILIGNIIAPINALALGSTKNISVSFKNTEGVVKYAIDGEHWDDINANTADKIVENSADLAIKISPKEGFAIDWTGIELELDSTSYNLNSEDNANIRDALISEVGYKIPSDIENVKLNNIEFRESNDFSGTVLFVWNYENKFCVGVIDDLIPGGREGYTMNYIKESDVVDIITGTTVLDISKIQNDDYYWLWDSAQLIVQDENITKDWATFRNFIEEHKEEYAINPCGSINGNNTITTNGGMTFRATIYNDKYEAISFGASKDDYQYFPGFWDETFFSSTVDISGTTKANPAIYQAYLLERTIKLNLGDHSKSNIKSIKALDVNSGAVTIRNTSGNNYEITFNSNYYDKVTFEVTDVANNTYYIKIGRTVMTVVDNFGPDTTNPKLISQLYYPTNYDYNDFEVFAKVYYDDGTSITKKATPTKIGFLNGHEYDSYETDDAGKNLKLAAYSVDVDENVTNAYFTVVYKGALNGDTYGGTFAGSGKGANYDVEAREIIYE